jgi:hypothetical protein
VELKAALLICTVIVIACTGTPSLQGTYVGNEAASVLPAGERVPPNFRMTIEDDGVFLTTTQSFTADSGETVQLVWKGECDGQERPVEGALTPLRLSCRRSASGALINTIVSDAGSYVETCVLESKVRMTCKGEQPNEQGRPQAFSYAFDRQEHIAQ